ncbi:MAG TPA: hypothetical protein VGL23_24285, partial [Chloroflexota bacterium]
MTVAAASLRRAGAVGLRCALTRLTLAGLLAASATLGPVSPRRDVAVGLGATTRRDAFSIVGWEVAALGAAGAASLGGRLSARPGDQAGQVALVRAHFANTAEIRRLRARRDELFGRPPGGRADLAEVERQLGERQ